MKTLPGFNGAASLGPGAAHFRGMAGFASGRDEVLPMQDFATSGAFQQPLLSLLGTIIFGDTLRCCGKVGGHIYCTTYRVPFFENCRCLNGFPVCTPRVVQQH